MPLNQTTYPSCHCGSHPRPRHKASASGPPAFLSCFSYVQTNLPPPPSHFFRRLAKAIPLLLVATLPRLFIAFKIKERLKPCRLTVYSCHLSSQLDPEPFFAPCAPATVAFPFPQEPWLPACRHWSRSCSRPGPLLWAPAKCEFKASS